MSSWKPSTRSLLWFLTVAFAATLAATPGFCFGPAAHITVMEKVRQQLPPGSRIREALMAKSSVAAAGANGPDINYASFRGVLDAVDLGYAPWADRYHYHRVGSLAAEQLRRALASGNQAQIAWAAGWVTHVTGDLACHGTYVKPEAGVYLDDPGRRGTHKSLEQWAEPYVWISLGGHSAPSYSKTGLSAAFCESGDIPASVLDSASRTVFGSGPGAGDFRTWYSTYRLGIRNAIGYTYTDPHTATVNLNQHNRATRLRQACNDAVGHAVGLLRAAEVGQFSAFSDAWNLDAADGGRPIGTLTVTVHTANEIGAGTDADVYFGIQSGGSLKEWILDKTGYNDLEQNDTDDYYCYVEDPSFTPDNLSSIRLRMGNRSGPGPDWKCAWIRVWINGTPTLYTVDREFKSQGAVWQASVGGASDAINALAVTVHTGGSSGAGTDADIYFGVRAQDGRSKEWLLDRAGHDDFERNDTDTYTLDASALPFGAGAVRSYWIRMGRRMGIGPDWQCGWVGLTVNGTRLPNSTVDKWFRRQNDIWTRPVNGLGP